MKLRVGIEGIEEGVIAFGTGKPRTTSNECTAWTHGLGSDSFSQPR